MLTVVTTRGTRERGGCFDSVCVCGHVPRMIVATQLDKDREWGVTSFCIDDPRYKFIDSSIILKSGHGQHHSRHSRSNCSQLHILTESRTRVRIPAASWLVSYFQAHRGAPQIPDTWYTQEKVCNLHCIIVECCMGCTLIYLTRYRVYPQKYGVTYITVQYSV